MEISPDNPRAHREVDGIWNADTLLVLEWEVAERRVVIPEDLENALGINAPVLRWSRKKYLAVIEKHDRDIHVIHRLSSHLLRWEFAGEETGPHAGKMRVLFTDAGGRWYAISIGLDASGSMNVITVAGSSTAGFLANRLRSLRNVVRREK